MMQMVSIVEALENGIMVGDVGNVDGVHCCSVLRVVRLMQLHNFRCYDY